MGSPVSTTYTTNNEQKDNRSFFQDQIVSRGKHLLNVPFTALRHSVETASGIPFAVISLLSFGQFNEVVKYGTTITETTGLAYQKLRNSAHILSRPAAHFIRFINPKAQIIDEFGNQGLIFSTVPDPIRVKASDFSRSTNFLKKHVASRLTYGVAALVAVISRTADLALGLVALAFSVLSLGLLPGLNDVACRGLQAPAIISDLFYFAHKIINPQIRL